MGRIFESRERNRHVGGINTRVRILKFWGAIFWRAIREMKVGRICICKMPVNEQNRNAKNLNFGAQNNFELPKCKI